MSGLRHASKLKIVNPGFEVGPCTGRIGLGHPWERDCTKRAHWLVPEYHLCVIHLPPSGLGILSHRAELWEINIRELWESLVDGNYVRQNLE